MSKSSSEEKMSNVKEDDEILYEDTNEYEDPPYEEEPIEEVEPEPVEPPVQVTTVGLKHAFINLAQTIIASWDDQGDSVIISYSGENEFEAIVLSGDPIASYEMTTETPTVPELLDQERARMVVSKFQAKAALMHVGLLDAVQASLETEDAFTQLAWQDAQEYRRRSPMIAKLAASLGMTEFEVDDLFRLAVTIEA